ncbi:MAG: hypothetical protein ACE15F_12590 [bacterium]
MFEYIDIQGWMEFLFNQVWRPPAPRGKSGRQPDGMNQNTLNEALANLGTGRRELIGEMILPQHTIHSSTLAKTFLHPVTLHST